MASIRNEVVLAARATEVWDAVRDFGALHDRLVPGFVTDCRLEGDTRIVTFVENRNRPQRRVRRLFALPLCRTSPGPPLPSDVCGCPNMSRSSRLASASFFRISGFIVLLSRSA